MHAWVVVDALVRPQFEQMVRVDSGVSPIEIPVGRIVRLKAEVEPAARFLDDPIISLSSAEYELSNFFLSPDEGRFDFLTVFVFVLIITCNFVPDLLKLFRNFQMSVVGDQYSDFFAL